MNMNGILENLKQAARRLQKKTPSQGNSHTFEARYISFKELLSANTHLLNIIADIEDKLQGHRLFSMTYVRSQASRAVFYAMRMILCLNFIAARQYLYPSIVSDRRRMSCAADGADIAIALA